MGVITDAASAAMEKQKEMNERLKGRTPDQQKVIKYFYGAGGCLSKGMTDEEYESMVAAKVKSVDYKQKALDKIGVDESQVTEIDPVHLENYLFEKADMIRGKDNLWRSSKYQISWLFFSAAQVYLYQFTFDMCEDGKKESTEEYFWKDITNFSTSSETVEEWTPGKPSCTGTVEWSKSNVEYNHCGIIVPGDKLFCAMAQNEYTEKAIQGMKNKLREKKS